MFVSYPFSDSNPSNLLPRLIARKLNFTCHIFSVLASKDWENISHIVWLNKHWSADPSFPKAKALRCFFLLRSTLFQNRFNSTKASSASFYFSTETLPSVGHQDHSFYVTLKTWVTNNCNDNNNNAKYNIFFFFCLLSLFFCLNGSARTTLHSKQAQSVTYEQTNA